jgi:hypothetical protein
VGLYSSIVRLSWTKTLLVLAERIKSERLAIKRSNQFFSLFRGFKYSFSLLAYVRKKCMLRFNKLLILFYWNCFVPLAPDDFSVLDLHQHFPKVFVKITVKG